MNTRKRRSDSKRGHSVESIKSHYTGVKDNSLPRTRKPKFVGLRSKLGWEEFRYKLFESNEMAPRAKRLTNTGIEKCLIDEFGHHPSILKAVRGQYGANYHRQLYNRGRLRNLPPSQISFRYNEFGIAVDYRTGTKMLSPEDKEKIVRFYREQIRLKEAKYNERHNVNRRERYRLQRSHSGGV
jgi:hypothetical protein